MSNNTYTCSFDHSTKMSHVFLITGGSSGFGLNIALAALRAGHRVISATRNPEKAKRTNPEIEQLGGSWMTLDITDEKTESIVSKTVRDRSVDILVNSAGYALLGTLEDMR